MPKNKVYIFRHGQTYYNKNKFFTGHKDSKLTPLGKKQAAALARQLKNTDIKIAIQTSLSRSRDTLKEVLKYHPNVKKIEDNRLIERSYGQLAGRSHKSIIKEFGEKQFKKWRRGYNIRPPGGESFADVKKRVLSFIKDLKKISRQTDGDIIISAHGNSIRLFRQIMEKSSPATASSWTIPYDKIYTYEI